MATILLPRSGAGKGIIALLQQQLQLASFHQSDCNFHSSDRLSTAELTSAEETSAIKSFDQVPGPTPLPLIGNIWRFLPYIGEFHGMGAQELARELHSKYGDIVNMEGFAGRKNMVFVFRPEDVETVLRNEGPWPIREGMPCMEYYRKVMRKEFYKDGGGVLTEQGSKWMEARSKVNQPMMQPRISKRYIQPIGGVADEFIEKIRILKDEKEEMPKDFINELFKWSFESIAYVALDKRLGCLAENLAPDSEPQRMINAVGDFFELMFVLEMNPPIWRVFSTPTWKRFVKALDLFLEISVKYVDEAIQRANRRKAEGDEDGEPSVLERLLERADHKTASIMAQDMIFAGVDTTSYSVAFAMYQMSKNPDKQEMLFKELKRILPNKNDAITEDKLEEMKYLRACLKESSRTLPILSGNMRTTVKEIVLSNYRIPKGLWVVMSTTISRLSEEYFPLSDRYIPERWLKKRPTESTTGSAEDFDAVSKGKRHPFAFLPFGFGPRSCVGKRFADLEMEILLAKIVRNFHVEYNYGEMEIVSKILNSPKDPLRFKMTERRE